MSEELINVDDITEHGWRFTMLSFFSRNYDSPETSSFRLPKSFGVMCFNFFVIAFSTPIVFLIYTAFQNSFSYFQKAVALISLLLGAMFLVSAKNFMVESLTKDLHYWGSISFQQYERLAKSYRLQKNWNQAATHIQS
ncbi:hypothetical protein [Pedobacter agri]|uniref:hypothetical protein n=1 Tax=Pedobacter agri TaxID=454586 RepID=UPI00292E83FF|nr:hypothetical protein [Pedobacter agri]